MAVDLNKGVTLIPVPPAPSSNLVQHGDTIDAIREKINQKVFDAYCNRAQRSEIIHFAINDLCLTNSKAITAVDMELESGRCANEHKLLEELEAMLHRFTCKDKKLDQKERSDSIQMVCRSRPGYSKGLSVDGAEKCVVDFCRAHQVKVKVGLLRWSIP